MEPRTYLEAASQQGIEYDAIGLQFYDPGRDMLQMTFAL
jgi:hypothetical protein